VIFSNLQICFLTLIHHSIFFYYLKKAKEKVFQNSSSEKIENEQIKEVKKKMFKIFCKKLREDANFYSFSWGQ
jgi:hypothetical protein